MNNTAKLYMEERTYDRKIPGKGEVIAPFVVSREQAAREAMDPCSLKEWTLEDGRKVLVSFLVCEEAKFSAMMDIFACMTEDTKTASKKTLSLDALYEMEEEESDSCSVSDLPQVPSAEDSCFIWMEVEAVICEVEKKDPYSAEILRLLAKNVKINLADALGLPETEVYEKVEKAQKLAREVRNQMAG